MLLLSLSPVQALTSDVHLPPPRLSSASAGIRGLRESSLAAAASMTDFPESTGTINPVLLLIELLWLGPTEVTTTGTLNAVIAEGGCCGTAGLLIVRWFVR